ncbi:MAG: N-glycosylase, partial [Parasporobacterium sp.]|nr:N-glycosylase [Parasporobacterium sp.]
MSNTKNEKVVEVGDFSLNATMECGQCFNFAKLGENEYIITAFRHVMHVRQETDKLFFCNDINNNMQKTQKNQKTFEKEVDEIWIPYFDLNRDYKKIREDIIKLDKKMKEVVAYNSGIRLLNQEFYEMVISFIISQRQNIPAIKKIIRTLSVRFGDYLGSFDDEDYYAFPTVETLCKLTESDFSDCKTGYRAAYLVEASKWLKSLKHDLKSIPYARAKEELLKVKGIGEKVADCILLFGLKKTEELQEDVW